MAGEFKRYVRIGEGPKAYDRFPGTVLARPTEGTSYEVTNLTGQQLGLIGQDDFRAIYRLDENVSEG